MSVTMKKVFKIFLAAILSAALWSCSEDLMDNVSRVGGQIRPGCIETGNY